MGFNHDRTALTGIVSCYPLSSVKMVHKGSKYPDRCATIEDYAFIPFDGRDNQGLEIGGFASSAFDIDIYKGVCFVNRYGDCDWVGHDWVGHDSVIKAQIHFLK